MRGDTGREQARWPAGANAGKTESSGDSEKGNHVFMPLCRGKGSTASPLLQTFPMVTASFRLVRRATVRPAAV
jgi:hypothetical protein